MGRFTKTERFWWGQADTTQRMEQNSIKILTIDLTTTQLRGWFTNANLTTCCETINFFASGFFPRIVRLYSTKQRSQEFVGGSSLLWVYYTEDAVKHNNLADSICERNTFYGVVRILTKYSSLCMVVFIEPYSFRSWAGSTLYGIWRTIYAFPVILARVTRSPTFSISSMAIEKPVNYYVNRMKNW